MKLKVYSFGITFKTKLCFDVNYTKHLIYFYKKDHVTPYEIHDLFILMIRSLGQLEIRTLMSV